MLSCAPRSVVTVEAHDDVAPIDDALVHGLDRILRVAVRRELDDSVPAGLSAAVLANVRERAIEGAEGVLEALPRGVPAQVAWLE